jgi:hypothetical protein
MWYYKYIILPEVNIIKKEVSIFMEALADVNQFGMCELTQQELLVVDGGWSWRDFGKAVVVGAAGGAVGGALTGPGAAVGAAVGAATGAAAYTAGQVYDAFF